MLVNANIAGFYTDLQLRFPSQVKEGFAQTCDRLPMCIVATIRLDVSASQLILHIEQHRLPAV